MNIKIKIKIVIPLGVTLGLLKVLSLSLSLCLSVCLSLSLSYLFIGMHTLCYTMSGENGWKYNSLVFASPHVYVFGGANIDVGELSDMWRFNLYKVPSIHPPPPPPCGVSIRR